MPITYNHQRPSGCASLWQQQKLSHATFVFVFYHDKQFWIYAFQTGIVQLNARWYTYDDLNIP